MTDFSPGGNAFYRLTTNNAKKILNEILHSSSGDIDFTACPVNQRALPQWDIVKKKCRKLPQVVFGNNTGLDLGCHPNLSISYVLPVFDTDISLGTVVFMGSDFNEVLLKKRKASYLQIVILRVSEEIDWNMDQLLAKRSIVGQMPGFMARSRGINTSIKLHKELLRKGFTRDMISYSLIKTFATFSMDPKNMSIILGIDCDKACSVLGPHIQEIENHFAEIKNWARRKAIEECEAEGDCTVCDDIVICSRIRTITRKREGRDS